ncbi:MAG: hypothetical protein ACOZB0_00075 [Pseudomonadota bacterium]
MVIEPVEIADFFAVFFSAAMVIVAGGLYALLFAYARLRSAPRLMPLAYTAYAVLFVAVMVLADVAHLFNNTFWTFIVVLMVVGYLIAPHAIWHLCVRTHEAEHEDEAASDKVFQQS